MLQSFLYFKGVYSGLGLNFSKPSAAVVFLKPDDEAIGGP
jgi:hypothetical protein